jgi:hypothetical protein
LVGVAVKNESKIPGELHKCLLVRRWSLEHYFARVILLRDTLVAQAHYLHKLREKLFLGKLSFGADLDVDLSHYISFHVLVKKAPVESCVTYTVKVIYPEIINTNSHRLHHHLILSKCTSFVAEYVADLPKFFNKGHVAHVCRLIPLLMVHPSIPTDPECLAELDSFK